MARHRTELNLAKSVAVRMVVLTAFVVAVAGTARAYEVPSVVRAVDDPGARGASVVSATEAAIGSLDPLLRRAYDIRHGLVYVLPSVLGPFLPPGTVPETPFQIAASVQRPLFPPVPPNTGSGRRIVYDKSDQRIWIISETGRILDSYLVSGRLNEPRPGTYRVYSKSLKAVAFYDGITFNWMVRFAYGSKNGIPIGFHDLPLYADGRPMMTEDQFGTPLSGGCVRQPDHKARSLYGWADVGTVVVVQS